MNSLPRRPTTLLSLFALRPLVLCLLLGATDAAHAGLFDDNEARQAILDLRAEVKQLREADLPKLTEQNNALQRSLLDLQAQIDQVKQNQAQQTGRLEELENRVATAAKPATESAVPDVAANTDTGSSTSLGNVVQVRLDGQTLEVGPEEKRQFDASLALFQAGNFAGAERALTRIAAQNGNSAYAPWIHYWVGNSQFAQKRYAPAVESFRRVISIAPSNPKASDAALSIANCQAQLGNAAEAKKTLENLIKVYPRSEAADSARERLAHSR
jgi:tol-pal system protein YbgF